MTGWRSVWTIARFGWKRDWIGVLICFLFALYVGSSVGFTLQQLLAENGKMDYMYLLIDWMYLMMFPVFGQLMNRTSFAVWREDVYTKKMAHWRTMPVPLKAVVQARILSTVIQVPVVGIAFLALQYGISPALRDQLPATHWLAVGLIWICYSLGVNAVFIWLELGFTGKQFVIGILVFMLICVIVAGSSLLTHIHLFKGPMYLIRTGQYGWLPVFLLVTVAAIFAGYRATLKRMRNRSYVF
jgi:hypothetical protein